jgi:hypothetical protein
MGYAVIFFLFEGLCFFVLFFFAKLSFVMAYGASMNWLTAMVFEWMRRERIKWFQNEIKELNQENE